MKPPAAANRPRFPHICSAGMQPWFGLGDALPMHFDVSVDDMHSGGYRGQFDASPAPVGPVSNARGCSARALFQ